MSAAVNREIVASVNRLVTLGRSEGMEPHRIREIVLSSMKAALVQHPDPWRQESLFAAYARALDQELGKTQRGKD